ncbi:hypothetical protein [Alkalimarinus alittae]|uniref:Vimentin n=1 Tax=Alkalimarinus alittae TaxID=2961619 RepID=A0ABY6N1B4_9ALTE|nr:hypothetical protein [Alkalimarinus alittae]UZE95794.1 hypothetical protein NKI27_17320 [Alkalimarinus alittae]
MNFIRTNHAVQCVRTRQVDGREVSEVVVSFDEQLNTIAPHVSALLSTEEVNQLGAWLEERARLQHELKDKPLGITVLEALPGLLQEATDAVRLLDTLDSSLHNQIEDSLRLFRSTLDDALHTNHTNEQNEFDSMQDEEVLKEQLTSIKSKV